METTGTAASPAASAEGVEHNLISFDDEPATTLPSELANMNLSSDGDSTPSSSATPAAIPAEQANVATPTATPASNISLSNIGALVDEEEQYTFQIKDVTDYSKPSVTDSLEIAPSDSSEGLLRGWSQDDMENDQQGLLNDNLNGTVHTVEDGTVHDPDGSSVHDSNQANEKKGIDKEKALKALKKASVAVTGTALVVAGIPLIPMPTPGGVIVSGSGLALLATEFPAAQRVLDKGRDGLERMVGEEGDDSDSDNDDESTKKKKKDDADENHSTMDGGNEQGYAKIVTNAEDYITPLSSPAVNRSGHQQLYYDDDSASFCSENVSLVSMVSKSEKSISEQRIEKIEEAFKNAKATTKKTGKKTKRNLKKFVRGTILPLMSKITTDKNSPDAESDGVISSEKKGDGANNTDNKKQTPPHPKFRNRFRNTKDSGEFQSPKIADMPENYLSETKLRSGNANKGDQDKSSRPGNLQGAFPVRINDAPSTPPVSLLE